MERKVILVVDDEPAVCRALARLLRPYYDVLVAYTARNALQILSWDTADAMILDVIMPGLDGLSLLDNLLGKDPTWSRRVVVLSASGAHLPGVEEFCRTHGIRYMSKPYEMDELLEVVADLVKG